MLPNEADKELPQLLGMILCEGNTNVRLLGQDCRLSALAIDLSSIHHHAGLKGVQQLCEHRLWHHMVVHWNTIFPQIWTIWAIRQRSSGQDSSSRSIDLILLFLANEPKALLLIKRKNLHRTNCRAQARAGEDLARDVLHQHGPRGDNVNSLMGRNEASHQAPASSDGLLAVMNNHLLPLLLFPMLPMVLGICNLHTRTENHRSKLASTIEKDHQVALSWLWSTSASDE